MLNISKGIKSIQSFFSLEAASGILLFVMAVLALLVDNSSLAHFYNILLETHFTIGFDSFNLHKPLLEWIDDGAMSFFFFLVVLELKREVLEGHLNSLNKMALSGIAALGGMIVPALIYVWLNRHFPANMNGWAIPTATDIAFALGILTLLGKRIPSSLKIWLTALAVFDDLGAIVIIATYYSHSISYIYLLLALFCFSVLLFLNRMRVVKARYYLVVGLVMWLFVLESGLHATLVGVLVALTIPMRDLDDATVSPLRKIEHLLQPWVIFLILPIFAFTNAGISLGNVSLSFFTNRVTLGICLGLFLGKQLGIFGASWAAIKLGIAKLPEKVTWLQLYGASVLCGIGFTMSLFIGALAFASDEVHYAAFVRLGVLIVSIISGVVGFLILYFSTSDSNTEQQKVLNQS